MLRYIIDNCFIFTVTDKSSPMISQAHDDPDTVLLVDLCCSMLNLYFIFSPDIKINVNFQYLVFNINPAFHKDNMFFLYVS